jgi:hypothetical protein
MPEVLNLADILTPYRYQECQFVLYPIVANYLLLHVTK